MISEFEGCECVWGLMRCRIGAVYDFVRSTLAEGYRSKPFTLCTSPPPGSLFRRPRSPATHANADAPCSLRSPDQPPNIRFPEHPSKLPPSKKPRTLNQFTAGPPQPPKETLLDLQLVPQSVLLVRFEDDELNRTPSSIILTYELTSTAPKGQTSRHHSFRTFYPPQRHSHQHQTLIIPPHLLRLYHRQKRSSRR